ncbi:phosphate ABC transporter permease subunit PstC [Pelagovum pacificum]|uniref:Phosphate transport system permease protein n=1 Tax=Pelagovum pacificum TaxID=2588711 RepID=A0A5C5GC83_9RHOB|nr:phosphate ABC transporter permease subunit PstC [Pelagovum pacificum]QQA44762.1 phosphate ABC transporter permease subunit PstC [Pelagovum pacificum]TNY32130.1 phosphate ABC transporter permease subunit PstC [Pelagovum pacificum]
MSPFWIFVVIVAVAIAGYFGARQRAFASGSGDIRNLHSLPNFYGMNALLAGLIPALLVLGLWSAIQPIAIKQSVQGIILEAEPELSSGQLNLEMTGVQRLAEGLDAAIDRGVLQQSEVLEMSAENNDLRAELGEMGIALTGAVTPVQLDAAQRYLGILAYGDRMRAIAVIALSLIGTGLAFWRTDKDFRARNSVERVSRALLLAAASIAILTTLGIVLSLIFNTVEFLRAYPADQFFFGTRWNGTSQLGLLPLLWGTLYISVIALVVAVPIGLFAAIYLSEYASRGVRNFAKPALEVLAGIPTIVYGLFALLTVGPFLLNVFGGGGALGVDWMSGATAVMTAGLVMGIMLIPFVSSLSDDIINAVPQAMRDGSYGLGATQSETIRQVILPAALPGIVGAILLAASRAIGETMIVVLGAGAAARLSMNPFEAMTTVTTRIVSQLTGDADFTSPEALVAFALGMTLFVITLGLNVFALYIVRKYREQYE